MSEESTKTEPRNGRPALPIDEQGELFGRLSVCERGSPRWRAVRLEMAARFGRTERAIEQIYERRAEEFVRDFTSGQGRGRGARKPQRP